MADIQALLKNILSAVYGKDVRQSIHDSIKQCYYDGKAGAIDLDARERAEAAEARMDTFTKLPSGSTSGDAELMDIRVGLDGTRYNSAGAAVREQIRDTHTIEVKDTQPTKENTQLWIRPSENDSFGLPEIRDDDINPDDTWSSRKISNELSGVEIKWFKNNYITNTGIQWEVDAGRMCSDYIPCPAGIDVSFIAETAHTGVSGLTFFDINKKVIGTNSNIGENGVEYTVTSPEGTRFLKLSTGDEIGWSLTFSETPIFKLVEEFSKNSDFFESNVDARIAYESIVNGSSKEPHQLNTSGVTYNSDGSVTVAVGGWYFLTAAYKAFGGNTYVGVRYALDDRISVGYSKDGTTTVNTYPMLTSEKIGEYEVVKITKDDGYDDCPYVIIRIDNRAGSTPLVVYDVKIIDGGVSANKEIAYVSVDGSDNNDGTLNRPFATIDAALTSGASDIRVMSGEYEQTIDLVRTNRSEISISSYTKDGSVVFKSPDSLISDTEIKISGYSNVYAVTVNKRFETNNIWIFQDGVDDKTTLISDAERHPLQRGYKYRCNDTKIVKCDNTNLGDALNEIETSNTYKWYLDEGSNTLYFSRPQEVSSEHSLRGSFGTSFFKNAERDVSLELSGIEVKYMAFDVSKTTNTIVRDCKATNVYGGGAFLYNHVLSCEFIRCEAARCYFGPNGDGFNAHSTNTGDVYSKQTTVTLTDCWSHDNNDDGYSDHERSEIIIRGGLYEYNCKGGVVPSYGSHCSCYNVYSRNNYCGFYYVGTTEDAEGGMYGQMYCHNCIAEKNNRGGAKAGFRVDGDHNNMTIVNGISISNGTGYAIGNQTATAKLIYCTSIGDDAKSSGITISSENVDVLFGTAI